MSIRLNKLLLAIIATLLPCFAFAYSGNWSVLNASNVSVTIERTLAEHGDFHCSTANDALNEPCTVAPNQTANIKLTTTSSMIHEDFIVQLADNVGVSVSYECGTPAGQTVCTGPHLFNVNQLANGYSVNNGYALINPTKSQQILIVGQ